MESYKFRMEIENGIEKARRMFEEAAVKHAEAIEAGIISRQQK